MAKSKMSFVLRGIRYLKMICIAAVALQHGLALVTRDTHFDGIKNLKSVVW
jgi:predicted nucleic acid-binding protein